MKSRGKATRGWYGARLAWIAAIVMSSLLVAAVSIAAPGGEKGKPESQPNSSQGNAGKPGGQQGQGSRADARPPASSNAHSHPNPRSEPAPRSHAQSPSKRNGPKSADDSHKGSPRGKAKSAPPKHADGRKSRSTSRSKGTGGPTKSNGRSNKSNGRSNKSNGRSNKSNGDPTKSTGHSNEGGRERLERDSRTGSRDVKPQDRGPAEWTTYCHSTRSTTNPFVLIRTNNNALWAHDLHHDGDDVIPATDGECPPGTTPTRTDSNPRPDDSNGPLQRTTDGGPGAPGEPGQPGQPGEPEDDGLGVNGVEDAEDVVRGQRVPGQGAPEGGVRGVSESSPGADDGDGAGPGIAEEGANEEDDELPFTGLGLIAILAAALLALGGGIAARHWSS